MRTVAVLSWWWWRIAGQHIAFLFLFPGTLCQAAEIFRWVDEDGRVQFGDHPPADAQTERIAVDNSESVSGDLEERRERRERFLGVIEEQRAEDARAAAEAARQEAQRREKCRAASDRLRQIEEARVIYEPTADAYNPRILDEEERNEYLSRAKQDVSKWCG
jgi:hypothetical protein